MEVAVVGSGVAGLAAAHALAKGGFRVTVLEADSHVGGHAHTMVVDGTPVDVGFMVFNGVTYPNMASLGHGLHQPPFRWVPHLARVLPPSGTTTDVLEGVSALLDIGAPPIPQIDWFDKLGVAVEPSSMSFSVSLKDGVGISARIVPAASGYARRRLSRPRSAAAV